tara:strand:+ start:108 stop:257 length:150 start_codon:yes stop_codon:yes gene_type:complete
MCDNMFLKSPNKDKKEKKVCSCEMERKKKTEKKKLPLEKLTTINNVRIV